MTLSREQLDRIQSNIPGKVSSIKPRNHSGFRNDLYDVFTKQGHYILRVPKLHTFDAKNVKEREYHALSLLQNETFVPKVLFYDTTRTIIPVQYTIVSYEEGETQHITSALIPQLADILNKTHSITFPNWGFTIPPTRTPYTISEYIRVRLWKHVNNSAIIAIVTLLQKYSAYFEILRPSLIHADLHESNIIKTPDNNVKIIDWELAHAATPALDIATLFDTNAFTEEMETLFYQEYGLKHAYFKTEVAIWKHINQIAALVDDTEITPPKEAILHDHYHEIHSILSAL